MLRSGFLAVFFILFFSSIVFAASPVVSSDTHPSGVWSSVRVIVMNVSFDGAQSFAYLVDQNPDTIPDISSDSTTIIDASDSEIFLGSKLDGIYWFHVRAKNSSGWSDAAHFEIRVDALGPSRPGGRFPL